MENYLEDRDPSAFSDQIEPLVASGHRNDTAHWRAKCAATGLILLVVAIASVLMLKGVGDTTTAEVSVGQELSAPSATGVASAPERLISRRYVTEVLANGSLRSVSGIAADMSVTEVEPLADGGLVMLGYRSLDPSRRADGPHVDGVTIPLVVVDAGGAVVAKRDVRVKGETVDLLGVTRTEALLQRTPADSKGLPSGPARIVAHDLLRGGEREVTAALPQRGWSGDVGGSTLAVLSAGQKPPYGSHGTSGPCRLEVIDLSSGLRRQVELPPCVEAYDVNLSPDGLRAGVAYAANAGGLPGVRLVGVDIQSGRATSEEFLGNPVVGCPPEVCPAGTTLGYLAMAWVDGTTLRLALEDVSGKDRGAVAVLNPAAVRVETRMLP